MRKRSWLGNDLSWVTAFVLAVVIGGMGWGGSAVAESPEVRQGVVVEEVGEGSALEKAGLRPGDVVLAWERLPAPPANPEGAEGPIESVFDWMWLEVEQAPRGTVKLTGQRGGEIKVFEVVAGKWEAALRARMPDAMLGDYARGKELIDAEELEAGIDLWHKLAGIAENQAADGRLRCWLLLRIGDAWGEAREWEKAHGAYQVALDAEQDPQSRVAVWQAIGDAYKKASDFEAAREAYGSAQEIRERVWDESLASAKGLFDLGKLDWLQGRLDSSQGYLQRALKIRLKLAPGSLDAAASLNSLGILAYNHGDFNRATEYFEKSLEILKKLAPDSLNIAASLNNLGSLASDRGDLDRAVEYHEESLEIRQKLAPGSLDMAMSLQNLGILASDRGDLDQATDFFARSLEIKQKLAPGSLDVAMGLNSLGSLASVRGDLARATEYLEGALEIQQKLAPGSLYVAMSLDNLGNLATRRGDLAQAAKYREESLEIRQKLAPGSLEVAKSLNNLGTLASERGDLARAAEYYEGALEIKQKWAPGSLGVAMSLNNLGAVAYRRGDLARAAEYFERVLEIMKTVAPDSLDFAANLGNLGLLASERGDSDLAAEYHERALEIEQKLAPDSLAVAISLNNLGVLASKRGDSDQAAGYYEGALAIKQKLAPGSLDVALSLANLGMLAATRGDLNKAAKYYKRALKIQQKWAPGSSVDAVILRRLASIRRKQSQPQRSLTLLLQALHALESQILRLGGSRDIQADFRAERLNYYHDTIDLSLEFQRIEEAFHVLERSRAQSFLAQLTERDLIFSGVPDDLDRQRRRVNWSYNETQDKMTQLNLEEHRQEIEDLQSELRRLRRDYEDVTEKIIKASPRFGALRYPQPLDFFASRDALDSGTAMLSYSVGEAETHLFVLMRGEELQVKTLPVGQKTLRGDVERILELQKRKSSPAYALLHETVKRLYKTLIQPVEESVARSQRLLIVPDGPLHLLPFALLIRETGPEEKDFEYLVERKPIHSVLSATVYAELKKQRRGKSDKSAEASTIVAFGDAQYSSDFDSLPYSREVVTQIADVYPEGVVRVLVGGEASEENAKAIGKSARILHFATHGRFDDRFPLNSYVALTMPGELREGQENGLLQAWEIFESVRLDADLVVLSACKSGLGSEVPGEGLKGLTRAFQYAGARTVASTLWKVEDQATAELMYRFYSRLKEGMPKDEALRAAQLDLIRGPIKVESAEGEVVERDYSAPYYWAAFQLIGDWR